MDGAEAVSHHLHGRSIEAVKTEGVEVEPRGCAANELGHELSGDGAEGDAVALVAGGDVSTLD